MIDLCKIFLCVLLVVLAAPLVLFFWVVISSTVHPIGSNALFSLLFAMNDLTVLVLAVVLLFVNKTYDIVEEKNLTARLLAVILIKVNKTYDIVGEKKLGIAAGVIYAMDPLPPYPKKIALVSGVLLFIHNHALTFINGIQAN